MLSTVVTLRLLGSFDLRSDGDRVELPLSVQRVIAYVALQQGSVTRTNVAGNLWLDAPGARSMANLRSALWRLRRPRLAVLDTRGESLSLAPSVRVDAQELQASSRFVTGGEPDPGASDLDRLVPRGELLGDWDDEWVLVERERYRQLRLQALERLAIELTRSGDFGRAAEAALAAVASEPLRESAHRALITVHLAQGNQAEAIRQYGMFTRLLRDELALEPSVQMHNLVGGVSAKAIDRVLGPVASL